MGIMQAAGRGEAPALAGTAAAWHAVLDLAQRHPEDPALFHPDGFDVRWRSWRTLAVQAAEGARAVRKLLAGGAGAPPRIAITWRSHPDAVAAYLAVLAAGGRPVAVSSPAEATAAGCVGWLLQPGEAPPAFEASEGMSVASLPEADGRQAADLPAATDAAVDPPAEVASLGERIARAAAASDAAGSPLRPGAREIAFAHLDLRRPGDEAFLGWALANGAAIVLEPDRRAVASFAAWARPTLIAAGAHELADLARNLRGRGNAPEAWTRFTRWLARLLPRAPRPARARRPLGRLRLVVVLGEGRLPVDDVPFWADRGVAVVRAVPAGRSS